MKAAGWDINEMTIPTGESDKRYATKYEWTVLFEGTN